MAVLEEQGRTFAGAPGVEEWRKGDDAFRDGH